MRAPTCDPHSRLSLAYPNLAVAEILAMFDGHEILLAGGGMSL
jgi:hypothetical protein